MKFFTEDNRIIIQEIFNYLFNFERYVNRGLIPHMSMMAYMAGEGPFCFHKMEK